MNQSCESCGARLDAGAEVCSLCGTAVPDASMVSRAAEVAADVPVELIDASNTASEAPVKRHAAMNVASPECDRCGHLNPQDSRYCNRCGTRLLATGPSVADDEEVTDSERVSPKAQGDKQLPLSLPVGEATGGSVPKESQAAVGRQIMIVVSAALLLVVALYVVTTMSGGSGGSFDLTPSASTQGAESPPLASQWQDREEALLTEVEAATTEAAKIDARRSLIDLYFAADRLDMAAEETVSIASQTNSGPDWIAAGNLFFDWMQRAVDGQKTPWARKAIDSYQQALLLDDENLDVRTDMAIAYLYDPENAMMAIQETNKVLESDSLHIQANFNRGIMLTQINRRDQALEQFEKVKRIIGDSEDPVFQRASDAIARLQGQ